MSYGKGFDPKWDITITRAEAEAMLPALIETVRDFTQYGLCRQANTAERKMLAEHYASLAHKALKDFPTLRLEKSGADTRIE